MIKMPARQIIAAIDAAAQRWSDSAYAPRARARSAVTARTGYSPAGIDYAFDQLFGQVRSATFEAVIRDEIGSVEALDGFVVRHGRPKARALPVGRVCIVSSRTTIGVAILPALFALCAKCRVLVKDREDHLVGAFFETLAAELPELAGFATAQVWSSHDGSDGLGAFDSVVAFGDDATLATIASIVRAGGRFIGYGFKASAGYVTREALSSEVRARSIAQGAALDLALYESEGCLSLHALFAENGGVISVERFAELLADAMRQISVEIPSRTDAETKARRAVARDLASFRSRGAIHSDSAGFLALLDPPFEEPPLFLPRTVGVHAVDDPVRAAEYFERHGITLEALAIAETRADLLDLAIRCKAARVAPFGKLQAPPAGAFHGGRPRIAEFVRWIGDET